MTNTTVEPLWDVNDVAEYLRIPVQTLYQWHSRGTGPQASKLGRHLRYDPAEVRDWFKQQGAGVAR